MYNKHGLNRWTINTKLSRVIELTCVVRHLKTLSGDDLALTNDNTLTSGIRKWVRLSPSPLKKLY